MFSIFGTKNGTVAKLRKKQITKILQKKRIWKILERTRNGHLRIHTVEVEEEGELDWGCPEGIYVTKETVVLLLNIYYTNLVFF